MEKVRQQIRQKQDKELTMMPKTLQRRNYELLRGTEHQRSATGDHNQDLYQKSKEQEKSNKESDEYWYERAKLDCTFAPSLEKKPIS